MLSILSTCLTYAWIMVFGIMARGMRKGGLGLGKNLPNPHQTAPTRTDLEEFLADSGRILPNPYGAGWVAGIRIYFLRIPARPA